MTISFKHTLLPLVLFAAGCVAPTNDDTSENEPSLSERDRDRAAQDGATSGNGNTDSSTEADEPAKPTPTKKLAVITGGQTSSRQFGVGGTDLGIPVRQPDGRIAYIFGDTFETEGTGGPGWRSPVLLRSEAGDYKNGVTFTSAAGGSYAKQLLDYSHANRRTYLPSDAITIGSRMYMHYMVNEPFGNVTSTSIAYSDDNGETWTKSGAAWPGNVDRSLRQLWTWERGDDGFVYTLSTKFDRKNPIILYRVPEDKILDPAAYVPWGYKAGQWGWGNPATPVLSGKFGEMCLRRVEGKWVLSYFNAGEYNITVLVFDQPTSNLYEAQRFVPITGGRWDAESDTSVAQLYGGYIHPDSTLHDMYLIVSQWNTGANRSYHAMEFVTGVDVK